MGRHWLYDGDGSWICGGTYVEPVRFGRDAPEDNWEWRTEVSS